MDRLLYHGCTPGSDESGLQNDLAPITGHTLQGSIMAPLVDGLFGTESQMEFQCINGLTADDPLGEQTGGKLEEPLLAKPGLKVRRTRGGVACNEGDITGVTTDDRAFGKMPPRRDMVALKEGGTAMANDWWSKGGLGFDGSKPAEIVEGGQGHAMSTSGKKRW